LSQQSDRLWSRGKRKYKTIILGARSGTTLVQKCLLITGMLNWGLWSIDCYEAEPPIKQKIWGSYPNVKERVLKPKYYWELAKSPVLGFVLPQLLDIYKKVKFIVMERPLEERVNSHINTWGDGMVTNIFNKMPKFQEWIKNECGFIPTDIRTFENVFQTLRKTKSEVFLKDYPQDKILRVQFHDLMKDFDGEMKKIADFLDINFEVYKGLWREMRKIKHMDTSSDTNKYI